MRKFTLSLAIIFICFSGIAQWNSVGQEGISNEWTVDNSIKTDTNGSPVITFFENQGEYMASCLRFNGTHWEQVGAETFYSFSIETLLDFEIDNKNNYYILYLDTDLNTSCIRFNGDTWGFVGSQYISTEYSVYNSLAVDTSGTAYVALQSQSGFSIVKENGESWMSVTINGLSGVDRYFDLVFDNDNVAFLGYCGENGKEPNCSKLANDNWEPVGSAMSSVYFVGETHLLITENHQLYMGFLEPDLGFYKFDALSNKWIKIETSGLGETYGGISDITSDSSSNIYIAILSDKARCYKYDGSGWSQLGDSGFSESEAGYLKIAMNKNQELFATFNDFTAGKAVVKKYMNLNEINNVIQNEGLKVYPNPAKDQFCIDLTGQKFTVIISDVKGRLVFENTNGFNKIEIDANILGKGIFIVKIKSDKGTYYYRKLIVR